jgi:hypothetical protein
VADTDDDTSNPKTKRYQWTTTEKARVIAILKSEKDAGNQADNGWKNCVWTTVSNELKKDGFMRSAKSCKEQWREVSCC